MESEKEKEVKKENEDILYVQITNDFWLINNDINLKTLTYGLQKNVCNIIKKL